MSIQFRLRRRHGPYVTWIVTVAAVANDLLLEPPTLNRSYHRVCVQFSAPVEICRTRQ